MKQRLNSLLTPVILLSALSLSACGGGSDSNTSKEQDVSLTTEQQLGKKLFLDESLSSNSNQSCATCHDPDFRFADPDVSVSEPFSNGSLSADTFGNRNAPTYLMPLLSQILDYQPPLVLKLHPNIREASF